MSFTILDRFRGKGKARGRPPSADGEEQKPLSGPEEWAQRTYGKNIFLNRLDKIEKSGLRKPVYEIVYVPVRDEQGNLVIDPETKKPVTTPLIDPKTNQPVVRLKVDPKTKKPVTEAAITSHAQMQIGILSALGWNLGDSAKVDNKNWEPFCEEAEFAAIAEMDLKDSTKPWAKDVIDLINVGFENDLYKLIARSFTKESAKIDVVSTHEAVMEVARDLLLYGRRGGLPTAYGTKPRIDVE